MPPFGDRGFRERNAKVQLIIYGSSQKFGMTHV